MAFARDRDRRPDSRAQERGAPDRRQRRGGNRKDADALAALRVAARLRPVVRRGRDTRADLYEEGRRRDARKNKGDASRVAQRLSRRAGAPRRAHRAHGRRIHLDDTRLRDEADTRVGARARHRPGRRDNARAEGGDMVAGVRRRALLRVVRQNLRRAAGGVARAHRRAVPLAGLRRRAQRADARGVCGRRAHVRGEALLRGAERGRTVALRRLGARGLRRVDGPAAHRDI